LISIVNKNRPETVRRALANNFYCLLRSQCLRRVYKNLASNLHVRFKVRPSAVNKNRPETVPAEQRAGIAASVHRGRRHSTFAPSSSVCCECALARGRVCTSESHTRFFRACMVSTLSGFSRLSLTRPAATGYKWLLAS